ncbi:ankyrin repeat-containing domain protein [Pyronema domesticum]|nr:ankyrin repeat-containing domain protein [Pyronema domesticum]
MSSFLHLTVVIQNLPSWDRLQSMEKMDMSHLDIQVMNLLMFACCHRRDAAAIKLLERDDIQVNLQRPDDGWTALMFACRYETNVAAMMIACHHGMNAAAMKLLERDGIHVNLQQKDGWTALMFVCSHGMDGAARWRRYWNGTISRSTYRTTRERRR